MADHFLTKTRVDLSQCLDYGDGLALDAFSALRETLKTKVGPEAAELFAEPLISRGNDTTPPSVSWYTETEGSGQQYIRLDSGAQSAASAELSRLLGQLSGLIDDTDAGPLVAAALHIRDPEDIWVVRGRPILINWGMLPPDTARDTTSRTAAYQRSLGKFLPLLGAPPLTAEERAARMTEAMASAPASNTVDSSSLSEAATVATPAAAGAATAAVAAQASSASGDRPAPPANRRVPLGAWLPLLLLLILAGSFLIWLLMPGNRIMAERQDSTISAQQATALAEEVNRDLEQRIVSLRAALDGAVCKSDGTLLMPDGVTIEGLLPPDDLNPSDAPGTVQQAKNPSILPPAAERVSVAVQGGFPDNMSLLKYIEERTAMVLVQGPKGIGNGTGFFVAPDLLITNYHVIDAAGDSGIYVTNKALASLRQAELVKALGPMKSTGGDFALLRIEGASQPNFDVLSTDQSLRLNSVIAAGYPGDLLRGDQEFAALRSGNLDAVPELAVTDGTVSAEQRFNDATEVIVHSAPISTGNSGGPLIDMCGRLVGVNTFVVQGPLRNLNFALSGRDLVRFLDGTAAIPKVVRSTCVPQIERPSSPVAEVTETQLPQLAPLQLDGGNQ
ncbi:MAG: serine protease [Pseudomonadota bacterium]